MRRFECRSRRLAARPAPALRRDIARHEGEVGAAAINIGRPPWTIDPQSSLECATNGTAETCYELSIFPSFEEAADDLSNPSFVSEKEPWTRTESPDRRRRSRAQSRRWSARRRAMPSSKPKEKPTRLKARFRAASKTGQPASEKRRREYLRGQAPLRKQDLPSQAAREGAATIVMSPRRI
jgi:hypothetical protein